MPIEKEQFLTQFTKQVLDKQVSLFLGAGSSRDVGYPNWSDLFAPLAKELGIPINSVTDYYRLAQYYSNQCGDGELRKNINDSINRNNSESLLLTELIKVGFTNIWTTNFDNALELNYRKQGILINKIFRDFDFSNVELNKRINIFKMNGDIENLKDIVATQNDYEKYLDNHRVMLMFFKRELISSTFLFIGYSFTDHLVLDCLSEMNRYLGDSINYHYTIMKNETENPYFKYFVDDLEKRYKIRVLLVNRYEDILNVLIELNTRIRNQKVFISGAFRSYEPEIEEYSHKLSYELTKSFYEPKEKYRIINGIGARFGTHLIGYANEHLAKQGIKDIEKYLIIRPFVGNDKDAPIKKKQLREKVIEQCGAAIFAFGEEDCNAVSKKSGVLEEFDIACQQHKTIIPIAYPGKISELIWKQVKSNITQYPYLEKEIDSLTSAEDPKKLSKIIVHILDSVREAK